MVKIDYKVRKYVKMSLQFNNKTLSLQIAGEGWNCAVKGDFKMLITAILLNESYSTVGSFPQVTHTNGRIIIEQSKNEVNHILAFDMDSDIGHQFAKILPSM